MVRKARESKKTRRRLPTQTISGSSLPANVKLSDVLERRSDQRFGRGDVTGIVIEVSLTAAIQNDGVFGAERLKTSHWLIGEYYGYRVQQQVCLGKSGEPCVLCTSSIKQP